MRWHSVHSVCNLAIPQHTVVSTCLCRGLLDVVLTMATVLVLALMTKHYFTMSFIHSHLLIVLAGHSDLLNWGYLIRPLCVIRGSPLIYLLYFSVATMLLHVVY